MVEGRGLFGGIFPWRNLSWGKKIYVKGVQDFLEFLNNNEKINMKKSFRLKVRSSESKSNRENDTPLIRLPNFIVLAYLEVSKVANPKQTDRIYDRYMSLG